MTLPSNRVIGFAALITFIFLLIDNVIIETNGSNKIKNKII